MGSLNCESCPFWDKANGVCYFPGDCSLPEENELLRIMGAKKDDSVEEAQKEVRA